MAGKFGLSIFLLKSLDGPRYPRYTQPMTTHETTMTAAEITLPATRKPTAEDKRAASRAGVTVETFGEHMNTARRADRATRTCNPRSRELMARIRQEAALAALDVHVKWGHLAGYGAETEACLEAALILAALER